MTGPRSLILALACLVPAAVAPAATDLPPERDRWIEVRSDNFTFFSNAGDKVTRRTVSDLERFRDLLVGIGNSPENNPMPISVYIFKSDQSFTPYKYLSNGRPAAATGFFIRRDDANYIAINAGTKAGPEGVVYHEFVHYYASTNLPSLPLWFEEGLAEVFQTFEVSGATAKIGVPIVEHVIRMRTTPPMPYETLFAVNHGSPQYTEESEKGQFYSQSWALVHYLFIGDETRNAETNRFVSMLHDGMDQFDAFDAAFTIDIEDLALEIDRYMARDLFPTISLSVPPRSAETMKVRTMSYSEALYRLGDLLMHQDRPREEVIDHFNAALEHDPENGPALSALGVLAEDRASWNEAKQYHDRAVVAAPNNPRVLFQAGSFLLHRGADVERARDLLRASTELDPTFAPTWVALSGSFMATGDLGPEALAAAETAHRLLPSRIDVSASLLRAYLNNDRRSDAVELVATAFAREPSQTQLAWGIIAREDLARARGALMDGRTDAALAAVDDAEAAARMTPESQSLIRQASAIRSNIEEYRVSSRYNLAVAAYNGGNVDGAREILNELSGRDLPGRHGDAVRSFLEFINDPSSPDHFHPPDQPRPQVGPSDIDQLNELITRGQLDEAIELLESFRARYQSDQRSWIDVKIEEIRFIRNHNRFAEGYNQAVRQFNGGAYAAAVDTLESLLAEQPDADGADKARKLLEEARSQL